MQLLRYFYNITFYFAFIFISFFLPFLVLFSSSILSSLSLPSFLRVPFIFASPLCSDSVFKYRGHPGAAQRGAVCSGVKPTARASSSACCGTRVASVRKYRTRSPTTQTHGCISFSSETPLPSRTWTLAVILRLHFPKQSGILSAFLCVWRLLYSPLHPEPLWCVDPPQPPTPPNAPLPLWLNSWGLQGINKGGSVSREEEMVCHSVRGSRLDHGRPVFKLQPHLCVSLQTVFSSLSLSIFDADKDIWAAWMNSREPVPLISKRK